MVHARVLALHVRYQVRCGSAGRADGGVANFAYRPEVSFLGQWELGDIVLEDGRPAAAPVPAA